MRSLIDAKKSSNLFGNTMGSDLKAKCSVKESEE